MDIRSGITSWDLERMLYDETAEPKALPLSLLKVITDDFSDERQIGSGTFAKVYKGKLPKSTVAVKRMSNTYMYEKEFHREVECLMMVNHKNVVRFLGYCADTQGSMASYQGKYVMADVQQRLLCFEYLSKGSLHEYITDMSRGLQWQDRYQIIMGICQGLHYLHQKNIVHLDLKPANILLGDNWVPKITDFGISRYFHEMQSQVLTKIAGTPGYWAPESFNHTEVTYRNSHRLDIYSLGVVIIEILTGKKGYHDVDKVVESWSNMLEKSRSDIQLKQVRVCAEIGIECTDFNPDKRPNTQYIINRLDQTEQVYKYIETDEFPSRNNDQGPANIDEGVYTFIGANKDSVNSKGLNSSLAFDAEKKPVRVITVAAPAYAPPYIDHQPEMSAEAFQVSNPYAPMGDNTSSPISESDEQEFEEDGTSGDDMDAYFLSFGFENFQIIENEDLEEVTEIGSGTSGTMYHGKWKGTYVTIKGINKSCFTGRSEQEILAKEFLRENLILSKLRHPNVIEFYGLVKDGPGGTVASLTEFMVNGSLWQVLQQKDKRLDLRKRLTIALGAAFGMEYLHSKFIVHLDLKCDNLLVNLSDPSRPICKVANFGLSKAISSSSGVKSGGPGTLPWMAPELLDKNSNMVSEKVDVFSFGIVMWEILTGEEPYANMRCHTIVDGIANNTLRPPVPASCDPEWRRLMEQCWLLDPDHRPTFTEIARRLRSMLAAANAVANAVADAGKKWRVG